MYFIIKGVVKDAIEEHKGLSTHIDKRRIFLNDEDKFEVLDQVFLNHILPEVTFSKQESEHIIALLKLTGCIDTALHDFIPELRKPNH